MRIHNDGLPALLDNYITNYPSPSEFEYECEACGKLYREEHDCCLICHDGRVMLRVTGEIEGWV